MTDHTPTPWFVSGVRFRMNGSEWQSVNRYDEAKKQDENIALVGYDPRTGTGWSDAHFIVTAVNNHDALVKALEEIIDADTVISDGGKMHDHGAPATIAIQALRAVVGGPAS